MKFTYLFLTAVAVFFVINLNAQNYSSLTTEQLLRLKNEAVQAENFEKAAQIKQELESRGLSNNTPGVEPYAELSISYVSRFQMLFDVLIDDVYVGTVSYKRPLIHINKIPEGRTNIKFISANNKFEFEKSVEIEAGKSYGLAMLSFNPRDNADLKSNSHLLKSVGLNMYDEKGVEKLKGKKGNLYIKFDNTTVETHKNAILHEDLDNISYPPAGFLEATKSYWYIETTTNGFSKKNGYSYNHSFGAKQPYLKFPNSGLIWGLESNVWMSEDLFPDGSGNYSGIPTSVSLNYILGLQYELLDFIIIYSTGSMGPALKETTKVTGVDAYGFSETESEWGVGLDSSADVGLIFTFGPDSRAGISLESNYNSHTGSSFAIGLVFGVTKVLKRHMLY